MINQNKIKEINTLVFGIIVIIAIMAIIITQGIIMTTPAKLNIEYKGQGIFIPSINSSVDNIEGKLNIEIPSYLINKIMGG